jgi:hypothetical protein
MTFIKHIVFNGIKVSSRFILFGRRISANGTTTVIQMIVFLFEQGQTIAD